MNTVSKWFFRGLNLSPPWFCGDFRNVPDPDFQPLCCQNRVVDADPTDL